MIPATELFITYRKAEELLGAGELRQAADLCKEILDADPGFPYGYHLMSSLFHATGTFEKALSFSQIATRIAPDVPLFFIQQGQVLFSAHYWQEAATAFEKAHLLDEENAWPLLLWGDACTRQGLFAEALTLFERARVIEDLSEVDEHEGLCLMLKGNTVEAEALFDRVILRRPKYYWGHIHKGRLLLQGNFRNEAEASFARALKIDAHAYEALHYMALLSDRQGQPELAICYAMQAIGSKPQEAQTHALLSGLLYRQNHCDAAEQVLRQVCAFRPYDPYILQMLIGVLHRQRKFADAKEFVETLMQKQPDNHVIRYFNAMLSGESVDTPPPDYIAGLFDGCAEQFDHHAQQVLAYNVPAQLSATLRALPQTHERTNMSLLDLGCGTGLAAQALRDVTGLRIGVDLSNQMLGLARTRQLYAELHHQDIVEYMLASQRSFDLVVAADVLVYVGNPEPFFKAARNVLADNGLLVMTIEKEEGGKSLRLHTTGRYAHSLRQLLRMAAENGYEPLVQEELVLRMEHYLPVLGALLVFKKSRSH